MQAVASGSTAKAPQLDTPRLACPLLLVIMTTAMWLLLGMAYLSSVRNLARMSRSPDPWAPSDAPDACPDGARIELAHATANPLEDAAFMAQNWSR